VKTVVRWQVIIVNVLGFIYSGSQLGFVSEWEEQTTVVFYLSRVMLKGGLV